MRLQTLIAALLLLTSLVQPCSVLAQSSKKKPAASAPSKPKAKPPAKRPQRRITTRRARVPANQRVPTRERYAEIQQALADAGFFTGEANGVWKQESIDALKAFQDSRGFEPTGKVDARSLIKLGLGATYGSSATNESGTGDARKLG